MSFKKNFYKRVSSYAAYNYLTQFMEFFSTIILSRLLLPEEYGFVAIIYIFSGFIQLFSNVGIGQSVIRSDYKYTFHKHLYSLSVWMGIALALIMIILSWPISIFFDNPALVLPTIVIATKFIFESFTYIPIAILVKELNFSLYGRIKLWAAGLQIILTISLAYLGLSYWALIIPLIISPAIKFAFLRKWVKIPLRVYGWAATKRILKRVRGLMGALSLNNFIKYWSGTADKVVIGKLYTQADLGIYNRAFRFVNMTNNLITRIFGTVLFPSLKKLMEEGGDSNKEFMDIIRVLALLNLPVIFILMVFPEKLVLLLWGNDWKAVAELLPYVGVILFFRALTTPLGPVYILYGKEKTMFLVNFANSILIVALVIIGGLISMLHILKFLALGFIFLTVPLNLYFGFYRSFGYKAFEVLRFWLPAVTFGILLFWSVYFAVTTLKLITFLGFLLLMLFELKQPLKESANVLLRKFFK